MADDQTRVAANESRSCGYGFTMLCRRPGCSLGVCEGRVVDPKHTCTCSSVDDSDGSAAASDDPRCPVHGWEDESAAAIVEPLSADVRIGNLAIDVEAELRRAVGKFAPFNSPHEGWAVIREELDELWEHVKANTGTGNDAYVEAIQTAAMALRYALDLCAQEGPSHG